MAPVNHSYGLDLGDIDGDGDLDAVVGNDGTPNKLWLNDGSAMFSDSGQSFYSASCYGIGVVDWNPPPLRHGTVVVQAFVSPDSKSSAKIGRASS